MHYLFSRAFNSVQRAFKGVTIKTTDVEQIIGISPNDVLDRCESIINAHPGVKAYILNVSWAPDHSEPCRVDERGNKSYYAWNCRVYLYHIMPNKPGRKDRVCIDWYVSLVNTKVSIDDIVQLVEEAFEMAIENSTSQREHPVQPKTAEKLDYSQPRSSLYDDAKNWDSLGDYYLK